MQTSQTLATGTTLQQGRYTIKRVLGQGGFGITYEGIQAGLNRRVAIKEFFMGSFCTRNHNSVTAPDTDARELVGCFMEKFVKEAQLIASMARAPHIVSIYDIFKENNTAYYVMEYIEGGSLDALVRQKGALPPGRAIPLVCQVAEALQALHNRNTMHLDIKPANILLRDGNDVVLIDFGVSKHYDQSGHQTTTTPVGYSKGFAPIEQYREGGVGKFSPATDIYSLGATFYYLLTATVPPEATDLIDEPLACPPTIIKPLWTVIEKSMKTSSKKRYQSIVEMTEALKAAEQSLTATANTHGNDAGSSADPKSVQTSEETILTQPSVETRPAQPSDKPSKNDDCGVLHIHYNAYWTLFESKVKLTVNNVEVGIVKTKHDYDIDIPIYSPMITIKLKHNYAIGEAFLPSSRKFERSYILDCKKSYYCDISVDRWIGVLKFTMKDKQENIIPSL